MNANVANEVVARFFAKAEVAGLKLPNGWFGRPFDSWFQLTEVRSDEDLLIIELDFKLRLRFVGPVLAEVDDGSLRVSGFTRLDWDWTEYGSGSTRYEEFASGSVEFIAPPG